MIIITLQSVCLAGGVPAVLFKHITNFGLRQACFGVLPLPTAFRGGVGRCCTIRLGPGPRNPSSSTSSPEKLISVDTNKFKVAFCKRCSKWNPDTYLKRNLLQKFVCGCSFKSCNALSINTIYSILLNTCASLRKIAFFLMIFKKWEVEVCYITSNP